MTNQFDNRLQDVSEGSPIGDPVSSLALLDASREASPDNRPQDVSEQSSGFP